MSQYTFGKLRKLRSKWSFDLAHDPLAKYESKLMKTITITVAGITGSGKTTIMYEIRNALMKAGLVVPWDNFDPMPGIVMTDLELGKRLDSLARDQRAKQLEIKIQEMNVNRFSNDDVPF